MGVARCLAAVAVFLALTFGHGLASGNNATAIQGGVARWSGAAATECGIFGRRYAAIDGTCYYPVDMKARPGVHEIAMWVASGARTLGTLTVTRRECARTEIALVGDTYAKISEASRARGAEERARIVAAVAGNADKPAFALPLGAPAEGIATHDPKDFCELRIYNGGTVKSRHTGLDYPLPRGTAVVAGANGKVVLAEDQFYTGKTVIVDHGGGLATMAFHLDEIAVKAGSIVSRGQSIGTVGSTGRSTGPHLHYGARYQNQRVDVGILMGDPSLLPDVAQGSVSIPDSSAAQSTEGSSQGAADPVGAATESTGQPPADSAAVDRPPADQTGAEVEVDPDEDAPDEEEKPLEKEAEEQRRADEAAKKQ